MSNCLIARMIANRTVLGCLELAVLAVICGFGPAAWAQDGKKLEIPKPENQTLKTKDGLDVHCTYFPGGFIQKTEKEIVAKPSKEVVPVIVLHGFEGNRKEFEPLALQLQRSGHAVITIDLRGHGDSNRLKLPNGTEKEIDPSRFRVAEFQSMENDVNSAKTFLLEKNDAGALNMELLCIVGADLGGVVATNWIAADWNIPDIGNVYKQGKYPKALVVLSPANSVKGYNATAAWKHPVFQSPVFSIMLVAGKRDAKSSGEANAIHKRLEKAHPLPEDEKDRVEKQRLFLIEPDVDLVGAKLVYPPARLPVSAAVAQFITLRLVNKQSENPWVKRLRPGD